MEKAPGEPGAFPKEEEIKERRRVETRRAP
jgi:hypothetical protein